MRAVGLTHHLLVDFITRIISDKTFNSWSSKFCHFFPNLLLLLAHRPNIFLGTLLRKTFILCLHLTWETEFHIHKKRTGKNIFYMFENLISAFLESLITEKKCRRRGEKFRHFGKCRCHHSVWDSLRSIRNCRENYNIRTNPALLYSLLDC